MCWQHMCLWAFCVSNRFVYIQLCGLKGCRLKLKLISYRCYSFKDCRNSPNIILRLFYVQLVRITNNVRSCYFQFIIPNVIRSHIEISCRSASFYMNDCVAAIQANGVSKDGVNLIYDCNKTMGCDVNQSIFLIKIIVE